MGKMIKVYVNRIYRKDGQPSKTKTVWASFVMPSDAEAFAAKLRRDNPKWEIEVI